MSTRQNKKQRKVRKDANARERTVTTLTEDPNTHYLVPTPSEEPPAAMSVPYGGNVGAGNGIGIGPKMHGMSMGPPAGYQMQNNNYGYGGFSAPFSPMQSMQQQQPPQYFSTQSRIQQVPVPDGIRPKVALPPGQNDLEILKNLKKLILDNQHPFYKAVPKPEALAKFYNGKAATSQQQSWTRSTDDTGSVPSGNMAPPPARQQRGQAKDRRSGGPNNYNQGNRNTGANVGSLDIANLKITKGPPSAGASPEASLAAGGRAVNPGYDSKDSDMDAVEGETPQGHQPPKDSDAQEYNPADGPSTAAPPSSTGHDRDQPRTDDFNDRSYDQRSIDSRRYSKVEHGSPPVARGIPPVEANVTVDARSHVSEASPSVEIRPPVDSRPLPPPDNRGEQPAPVNIPLEPAVVVKQEPQALSDVLAELTTPPGLFLASASAPTGGSVSDPSSVRPSLKDRINPPVPSRQITPTVGSDQHQDRSKRPNFKFQKGTNSGYNAPPHDAPPRPNDRGFDRSSTPVGPGGYGPSTNYRDSSPPRAGTGGQPTGYRRSPSRDGAYGGPPRGYDPRSPALDVRPKVAPPGPSPGSRDTRDYRGLPRDDGPRGRSYRPDSWTDSYPGGVDARYDDRRYRDYSPGRGPPPPSNGRDPIPPDGPPGRGDYHQYPPSSARSDWEDDYYKSRGWDGPPPRSSEGYDRDYPPRHAGYNSRPDRDYVPRDAYAGRPPLPPPIDDRYPPGRDGDRRPPPPAAYPGPPYTGRVRPRSPSPRRGPPGPDDSRPPLKRPRDDDYYPPGRNDSIRRPPGDYPHGAPPRSGSSGPPPVSSASSGWGPLPPSASGAPPVSGAGPPLDRDRDYRMGGPRDSMDYPPPGGYRPRSPLPPADGRGPYPSRGGYGRGAGDRGGYGPPRP